MSNLNPGGSRANGKVRRVFGAHNIAKACERNRVPDVDKPNRSPAGQDHTHSREAQRRLRQQERKDS